MRFWFWRRKKKESSRETAKKRLERLISTSRRREIGIQEIIPEDKFSENSEKIKERIVSWIVETFNVDRNKVKVEFEERNGHVIIITNVSLE